MNLLIVHSYYNPGILDEKKTAYLNREREIVRYINSNHSLKSTLAVLSNNPKQCTFSNDFETVYFPSEVIKFKTKNEYVSNSLLSYIRSKIPNHIIFYGMGFYLSDWLIQKLANSISFSFFVGGGLRDKNMYSAKKIFIEYIAQKNIHLKVLKAFGKINVNKKYVLKFYFEEQYQSKDFDIISVGRFIKSKNHVSLLPLLKKYSIVIIGSDGETKKNLIEFSKNHDLPLTILEDLSPQAVSNYMKRAKIMVHPSLSDGFPRAIAEGIASGLPIIAFKKTISGIINNFKLGELVNDNEIIEATNSLLINADLLENYSKNCKKYAKDNFSKESLYDFVDRKIISLIEPKNKPLLTKWPFKLYFNRILYYLLDIPTRFILKLKIMTRNYHAKRHLN